jgi:H+/gluconate symporter-like permease
MAFASGEGYGEGHLNEPAPSEGDKSEIGHPIIALLPLITVLTLNYVLTKVMGQWDPAKFEAYNINISSVAPLWALLVAVVSGTLLALAIGWKKIRIAGGEAALIKALSVGVSGSLLAIMNTSSEVGYGSVIKSLPAFKSIADFMMGIDFGTPLVSESITVNVLAGITGSASGGMTIALEAMGARYLEWANAVGLNPELLHRVAALSSGGFDSLPHNGAIITLLAICGMTHKQSYKDIGMVSVVIPFASTFAIIILSSLLHIA